MNAIRISEFIWRALREIYTIDRYRISIWNENSVEIRAPIRLQMMSGVVLEKLIKICRSMDLLFYVDFDERCFRVYGH